MSTTFPVYGFCLLVSASVVALLSMSADFFESFVDDIVSPCQHDSVWQDGTCNCDNTLGVFAGEHCSECQCKHYGVCAVSQIGTTSRWACRCPSHQKWVGTLCDKCYASHADYAKGTCRGECKNVSEYAHYGTMCDTVCMPDASSLNTHCREVANGGGTCNACNGHGACDATGQCQCDDGYYDSRQREQCSLTCENCPAEFGTCQNIGGTLQCVCNPGYFGPECSTTCGSVNEKPCSGHGTCAYDATETLQCTCDIHYTGDDCSQRCPGDLSYPTACSGHGKCAGTDSGAVCTCSGVWEGVDCSCSASYTCSGHGVCNDDATCACFDEPGMHFGGEACERCLPHWYGQECHLGCDPDKAYTSSVDTDGLDIGCNGHGACAVADSGEHVACVCDGTNPDTFCSDCVPDYYPKWTIDNVSASVRHCSQECNRQTCSFRGTCNPEYDGHNDLCICDTLTVGNVTYDTVDPSAGVHCSTCKPNWYPTEMDSLDRCTKYCAADGVLGSYRYIRFGDIENGDYTLQGDATAQQVCVATEVDGVPRYEPDADCAVCSGAGTCMANGQCQCLDDTTGTFCEIDCRANGTVCSGHGRCQRNELDLWFSPYSGNYRCECLPYDTYTSETRQRLVKRGFQVAPPPTAQFYGKYCEFHCPRFNEDVCAGRGDCTTRIEVDEFGRKTNCYDDADCFDTPGAFCARLTTPWDAQMKDSDGQVSGIGFFDDGPRSPGYYTCASSSDCIDSIYSVKWDEFCVNMLNGWYPNVLNTAQCAYNDAVNDNNETCQVQIENFFLQPYDQDKTWCEAATEVLTASVGDADACGKHSHADETDFNLTVAVCHEYTLGTTCNAQSQCIYDQTEVYIRAIDELCAGQTECRPPCQSTGNNTCSASTYCRAKTCPDIMYEHSVESLCLDVTAPTCGADVDWANFCADATGRIRGVSSLSSMDTFYSCVMWRNRHNPQHMETQVPGGIGIPGLVRIFGEDVSVQELRASVIARRQKAGAACQDMTIESAFCEHHLASSVPSWYAPVPAQTGWFADWVVACVFDGLLVSDSVWQTESEATARITALGGGCRAYYRSPGVVGSAWQDTTDATDTVSYSPPEWTLTCLGEQPRMVQSIDYSLWPTEASKCKWHANELAQRWGKRGATPMDVQRAHSAACHDALEAPWIPRIQPLPDLCSMGACHPDDTCYLCSDPQADCDASASVQCISKGSVDCRQQNRCQFGGNCYQPLSMRYQSTYLCDYIPNTTLTVTVAEQEYVGHLSDRGVLTVLNALGATNVTVGGVTRAVVGQYNLSTTDVSFQWSEPNGTPERAAEASLRELEPYTEPASNWFAFCEHQPRAISLSTSPGFGLVSGWTGTAWRTTVDTLALTHAEWQSLVPSSGLHVECTSRVRATCGGVMVSGNTVDIPSSFTSCTLEAVGQVPASCGVVELDSVTQMRTFSNATLSVVGRDVYVAAVGEQTTGLDSWSFAGDIMQVARAAEDDLPPEGVCTLQDAGTAVSCASSPPRGMRWSLDDVSQDQRGQPFDTDQMRVSGWTKITDTEAHVADVLLLNEDDQPIVEAYILAKRLYVNGQRTSCVVAANQWWHWHLDVRHHKEDMVLTEGRTVFDQEWHIRMTVGDCQWPPADVYKTSVTWSNLTAVLRSQSSLRTHVSRIAPSFRDVPQTSSEQCHETCVADTTCQQWSWSGPDNHCYLYAKRCHEDDDCRHGHGVLRSIQSKKKLFVEVLSQASGGPTTYWSRLRAHPLLDYPVQDPPDMAQIAPRWAAAFEAAFTPYLPDATSICAALREDWTLMPDYRTRVCYGTDCPYDGHDLSACAALLHWQKPNASAGCEEAREGNWTAFCHYRNSFDTTDGRIPFLGGIAGEFEDLCVEPTAVYDEAVDVCPSIDTEWFRQCFQRTEPYEEHCSSACLQHVESMLSNNSVDDPGICERRRSFLDLYTNASGAPSGVSQECTCTLNNILVTDFCLMQDAYHDGDHVAIPELYNSDCSMDCRDTMKQSMDRQSWRTWCKDFADGRIQGTCSKTACDCDHEEYIGVAGGRCELSCPSGLADGQEMACSGGNGQCFAKTPSEIISDELNQRKAGETREHMSPMPAGPLLPIWVKSGAGTVSGQCQCALGSGAACSIPCIGCNNGTYGPSVASQYGICDSFNGVCRALPAFMRFNTKQTSDAYVSYNTTAFESVKGVYKWQYPEQFLYEADETVMTQAYRYLDDPSGLQSGLATPNATSLAEQRNIETVLRVFRDSCWNPVKMSLNYLDNDAGVTNRGITVTAGETILKTETLSNWGQCQRIQWTTDLHLCFARGQMHAYDDRSSRQSADGAPGPLLVRSRPDLTLPQSRMSFAKRTPTVLIAYGGRIDYASSHETFNTVYQVHVERRDWQPHDIVFLTWTQIEPVGLAAPKATFAPMLSFYSRLVTMHGHQMYELHYKTRTADASWSATDIAVHRSDVLNIWHDNQEDVYLQLTNGSVYTYTDGVLRAGGPYNAALQASSHVHDGSVFGTATAEMPCTLSVENHQLTVSGIPLVSFAVSPTSVTINTEEWLTIDVDQNTDIVQRVLNTVQWRVAPAVSLDTLTSQRTKLQVVDILTRLDMHQSRFAVSTDLSRRAARGARLGIAETVYVAPDAPMGASFLSVFSAVGAAFFGSTPAHSPTNYTITFEGDVYERVLLVHGNYMPGTHTCQIDLESERVSLVTDWTAAEFQLRLQRSNGQSHQWTAGKTRTFGLVIHLEEWIYSQQTPFTVAGGAAGLIDGAALLQLFVSSESDDTYSALYQMNEFLEYTPSHCSTSASVACPGLLPYVNLPCTGRGVCSRSCQCTCDIAKSKLQASDTALASISFTDSPYRGSGCEITCPGWDGFHHDSICSNRGECQRDGTCSCEQGFTGDACQFPCPVDEQGDVCSTHGGCGTKVYRPSDFALVNNAYMDTLSALNLRQLEAAMETYYVSCDADNYVEQQATFPVYVGQKSGTALSIEAAKAACLLTNQQLALDYTVKMGVIAPVGRCLGLEKITGTEQYELVLSVATAEVEQASTALFVAFDCEASECDISVAEDDDKTLLGIEHEITGETFSFSAQYVHGHTVGSQALVVNNVDVYLDMEWTTSRCLIRMHTPLSTAAPVTIIDEARDIEYVQWTLTRLTHDKTVAITRSYQPRLVPVADAVGSVLLAPQYTRKYAELPSYTAVSRVFNLPSEDTGTDRHILTRADAEDECDSFPDCHGIVRWETLTRESLFSLYTEKTVLQDARIVLYMPGSGMTYLQKSSQVYVGRLSSDESCLPVLAGQSTYPKVTFTEKFDPPFQSVDLSQATDSDTGAVIAGDGLWTHCWTRVSATTKEECHAAATNSVPPSYGFAFSEDTHVCVVYTGITEPNKIQLDKMNSDTSRTIHHPCVNNAVWRPT